MFGFIASLIVTIIIVAIVERVAKTNLPYGWLGNIVAGFIGGFLGQVVLGQWGPFVAGVYLIQTFLGSLAFILGTKWVLGKLGKARR